MTPEMRPDPDALLRAVQSAGAPAGHGRLKVYFGANAGVGKTYAMLQEAQANLRAGVDVVAGVVETHGRTETAALLEGLSLLPPREVAYRGVTLKEFDLDSALTRSPQLILIDELAHSNAAGSRHAKRWQDVEELLAAGIDVFTTVNVQHIDSLNDVVAQITGVIVRETVPDAILEQADEVELIDISPEELLQRLKEGKVYVPSQAERALASFFTKANLSALRELALRKTAQSVDTQLQAERTLARTAATWPAAERILVCVSPSPLSADLVRSARRLAAETHAEWEAVYVETAAGREMPASARDRLADTLRLAESLGGSAVSLSGERVADTLVAYARQRNATKILVGKPTHPAWIDRVRGSLVQALIRLSGDIDVYVVRAQAPGSPQPAPRPQFVVHSGWLEYVIAGLAVAVTTGVAFLLQDYLQPANLIMLYLLAVVAVALRTGRGPSMLAALLAVGAFDFCFVAPYFTFAVRDAQYLITFLVMLLVSLVIANLTHRMKQQVQEAVARERRTSSLYLLSRELAAANDLGELIAIGERRVGELFHAQAAIVIAPADGGRMELEPRHYAWFTNYRNESAVMQWVRDNGKPAGHGTATLPGAEALHLPLTSGRSTLGVMALKPGAADAAVGELSHPEQRHMLDTCAALVALALQRALQQHSQEQAQLQAERERLRSTLLSSISHDLRTPLAGISGSAETLLSLPPEQARAAQAGLLGGIKTEAQRLSLLLENILDLTRLESGELRLRLEVQPLEEVVGSALGMLDRRLDDRQVELELPDDLPLVRIDAVLIERVLVNLLDNALKYTPAASPLTLAARESGNWVEVSLADRGPGLPPVEPDQLFSGAQPVAATSVSADGSRGTGLGLSICKALVEAHGGTIRAAGRPGGGSVFSFTIPASTGSPAAPAEPEVEVALPLDKP